MKKSRLIVAAAVLTVLAAAKFLLPDVTAAAQEKITDVLFYDRDYLTVFENLSDRLSLTRRGAEEAKTAEETPAPEQAVLPATRPEYISYHVEEAAPLGETAPEPALMEVMAVFLESQAAFSDYALPENVDYGYQSLPFDYALPVGGYNSSGFGYRMHPVLEQVRFHYGTDIAAYSGENVDAFADGTVTFAGYSDSFGNYITIDHGGGWNSLYAHCSYLYVREGQSVTAGEKIALVGATGLATGPHLHFELQHDGVYVNPEYYINSVAG